MRKNDFKSKKAYAITATVIVLELLIRNLHNVMQSKLRVLQLNLIRR